MEANQVHVLAGAVFCDLQQILDALEPRFTREIVGDVGDLDRRNRIDDDMAVLHGVATTDLDMGTRPDANAASDSPAPDSFAKPFGEHHLTSPHTRNKPLRSQHVFAVLIAELVQHHPLLCLHA
jgi:hypothetical protein